MDMIKSFLGLTLLLNQDTLEGTARDGTLSDPVRNMYTQPLGPLLDVHACNVDRGIFAPRYGL